MVENIIHEYSSFLKDCMYISYHCNIYCTLSSFFLQYLIKNGACLMQENKYGETPLELIRPRAAALIAPLAQALGHDLSHRRPFRDTSWIGTKTRARDATLYRLEGESWDPREVELTGALADGHGAEVLKGSFRRCPVVVKMLKLRNCSTRQVRLLFFPRDSYFQSSFIFRFFVFC
ncbi:unnamed protein product [Schistosoma curassoni]|uniref:ANK_REP_REGION domain-containing protein n=1 Tax=Schistosoma curassoni TaxID=6186 RepID=A0A183KYJ7_9TREM|nr:unnamed protein product [Schistosoma curassoni]